MIGRSQLTTSCRGHSPTAGLRCLDIQTGADNPGRPLQLAGRMGCLQGCATDPARRVPGIERANQFVPAISVAISRVGFDFVHFVAFLFDSAERPSGLPRRRSRCASGIERQGASWKWPVLTGGPVTPKSQSVYRGAAAKRRRCLRDQGAHCHGSPCRCSQPRNGR